MLVFSCSQDSSCQKLGVSAIHSKMHYKLVVRSIEEKIMTNRVKAPNLVDISLRPYKTNSEGVPRDPGIQGNCETQICFQ